MNKIVVLLLVMIICLAGCGKIDSSQTSNDKELLKVLQNEKSFIDNNENNVYLKDYKALCEYPEDSDHYEKDVVFVPKDYTFVDLDNDGKNELVVSEAPNADTYLILHEENKNIYGLCLYIRWFQSLKNDGTFLSSSGALSHSYNTIKFNKNSYKFSTIATFDFVSDINKPSSNKYGYEPDYDKSTFEIEGKQVSFEQILEFVEEWNKRDDAKWIKYKNDNEQYNNSEAIVVENNSKEYVNSNDLSDKDLVEIVAKNLGVPENANVTYEISENFFWDAGDRYFKNVSFYENGELVATASVDPVNGELIKNIGMYQN